VFYFAYAYRVQCPELSSNRRCQWEW